jgi:hypothetical protein
MIVTCINDYLVMKLQAYAELVLADAVTKQPLTKVSS